MCKRLSRRIAVLANECAVARLREEPRIDERAKHSVTRRCIKPPQALGLLGRQAETWHLQELASNTPHYFLNTAGSLTH